MARKTKEAKKRQEKARKERQKANHGKEDDGHSVSSYPESNQNKQAAEALSTKPLELRKIQENGKTAENANPQEGSNALDDLVKAFEEKYSRDSEMHIKCMEIIKTILENPIDGLAGVGGGIRHRKLEYRWKKVESAVASLRRRQKERANRARLKKLVGEDKWHDYCKMWGEDEKAKQTDLLKTAEEAYDAVHDLAGIRISLYFPGDVVRVKTFLEQQSSGSKLVYVKTNHKTDRDPRIPSLQKRIEEIETQNQGKGGSTSTKNPKEAPKALSPPARRVFAGYDAYHVVVKVGRDCLPDRGTERRPGEDFLVEIQLATAVMHAWQGVEHDIVYKGLGTEPPSEEQLRLIDLFNGIIMTGQVALEQLEQTTKRQDMNRAAEGNNSVQHSWELEAILAKHYEDHGTLMPKEPQWDSLTRLLAVLKATNSGTVSEIKVLLSAAERNRKSSSVTFNRFLPLRMAQEFSKAQPTSFENLAFSDEMLYMYSRVWALRLIHTLNMAWFFNVSTDLIFNLLSSQDKKPIEWMLMDNKAAKQSLTAADFLDLLHPTYVQPKNWDKQGKIMEFCRWVLKNADHFKSHAQQRSTYSKTTRLELARDLPTKSILILPKLPDSMDGFNKLNIDTYRTLLDKNLVLIPSTLVVLLYALHNNHPSEAYHNDPLDAETPVDFFIPLLKTQGNTKFSWRMLKRGGIHEWEMKRSKFLFSPHKLVEFQETLPGDIDSLFLLSSRLGVEAEQLWEMVSNSKWVKRMGTPKKAVRGINSMGPLAGSGGNISLQTVGNVALGSVDFAGTVSVDRAQDRLLSSWK